MKLNLKLFHRLHSQISAPGQSLASVGLMTLLGLSGVNWLILSPLTPQSAQAYTARTEITLTAQPGESFQTLVRRAEAVARAATQRLFDRDILVTDVAVTILGQNDGQVVPILSVDVSRQGWRAEPEASRWATYFRSASSLLEFRETPTVEAQDPAVPRPERPVEPEVESDISDFDPTPSPDLNTPNINPTDPLDGSEPGLLEDDRVDVIEDNDDTGIPEPRIGDDDDFGIPEPDVENNDDFDIPEPRIEDNDNLINN